MVRRTLPVTYFCVWLTLLTVVIGCSTIAVSDIMRTPTIAPVQTDTLAAMSLTLVASPAPLSSQAIAACPVTLPNGQKPLDKANADFNMGNVEGTLFTIPWPDGKVIFTPDGPGEIAADGSLSMKWPWYRGVEGQLVIEGRRLDAAAPPLRASVGCCRDGVSTPNCCYGETGFIPSILTFASEGCWEVTGSVDDQQFTFVTLAIKGRQ